MKYIKQKLEDRGGSVLGSADFMNGIGSGIVSKQKKMQYVQYECIKNELKEEYDKKVGFLNKRLNKQTQNDPNFLLINSISHDQ